jgi:hypothetical protein
MCWGKKRHLRPSKSDFTKTDHPPRTSKEDCVCGRVGVPCLGCFLNTPIQSYWLCQPSSTTIDRGYLPEAALKYWKIILGSCLAEKRNCLSSRQVAQILPQSAGRIIRHLLVTYCFCCRFAPAWQQKSIGTLLTTPTIKIGTRVQHGRVGK